MEETNPAPGRERPALSTHALAGFAVGSAAAMTATAAGLGYRSDLWSFATGAWMVAGATLLAVAAGAWAAVALWRIYGSDHAFRGAPTAVAALLVAGGVVAVSSQWALQLRSSAGITDISTAPRKSMSMGVVPVMHPGGPAEQPVRASSAALQEAAYPGIRPVWVKASQEEAFWTALAAAREMGWVIVAADAREGSITATDTSLWFGLRDDFLVRVAPAGIGVRVDARAVSGSREAAAFGTNVRRLRRFLDTIASGLPSVQGRMPSHFAGRRGAGAS